VVRLAYHPVREDMKRLRERWDREDSEDIPLKPFDTTLTSGISDTVQHLKLNRERKQASTEDERLHFDGIKQLTDEMRWLREELARIVETLNRKASKRTFKEFSEALSAKTDKRVDNIFKLVAALGVVLGVLIAVKGH
jgi:hypothetical protein